MSVAEHLCCPTGRFHFLICAFAAGLASLTCPLTHGQSIYYPAKATGYPLFFHLGETNLLGFNNQIVIFAVVAVIGAYVLAKTRWGYETFATGGNEQAASYAGIPTNWVRIRAYLISSLCAAYRPLNASSVTWTLPSMR